MLSTTIIGPSPDVIHAPARNAAPRVVRRHFPSAEMVSSALALFPRERQPERVGGYSPAVEAGLRFGFDSRGFAAGRREVVEGPRFRIEVGPGLVAVRSSDPVRAERSRERQERARRLGVDLAVAADLAGESPVEHSRSRGVSVWSRKSRARMVERCSGFDYVPFFAQEGRPAMVTLTYPGDWLAVAPDSATCHGHLLALRRRFERRFGRPLLCIWKREFQRRGAPHYHLFVVAPEPDAEPVERSRVGVGRPVPRVRGFIGPMPEATGLLVGPLPLAPAQSFRSWLAEAWASIVGHADPVERARHLLAGTAVDYSEGAAAADPRRLAVYFSKHGAFAAKDYQNEPPAEWAAEGSVGRFWGYWGLSLAVGSVEVAPDVAQAVLRAARRYSAANSYRVRVPVWRKRTTVDTWTGEVGFRWVKRHTSVEVRRLRGRGGYLVVNDGPAFAGHLSRVANATTERRRVSASGAGPVGFLP